MAISPGLGVAVKRAWLDSMQGDTFKIALYDASAVLSPLTETYSPAGEVKGQGYQAGGAVLSGYRVDTQTASVTASFSSPVVWKNATIKARGAVIYNASKGNVVASVVDFGQDVVSTNGNFTLRIPDDVLRVL